MKRLVLTLDSRLPRHCSYVPPVTPKVAPVESLLSPAPEQFVEFYYKTFDENRAGLASLYVCDPV